MRIYNDVIKVSNTKIAHNQHLCNLLESELGNSALRWYISQASSEGLCIEATYCSESINAYQQKSDSGFHSSKSAVLSIIPTGVGCEIGGYAGDAAPITRMLAACADYVITNPNALNASDFLGSIDGVLYTEGHCIDLLCQEKVDLWVPYANKIGLIIEKADRWMLNLVSNLMNMARAVYGVDIIDYAVTDEPIGSRSFQAPSGAYVGTIENPAALFKACDRLLRAGATAIGVTTNIKGLPNEDYIQHFLGNHPNPMGGVEALISHLIVNRYGVPAAHAPMINVKGAGANGGATSGAAASAAKQLALASEVVDPRGAGELVSTSGLACVLVGLSRAPQLSAHPGCRFLDRINMRNITAIVAPASAMGGVPILYGHRLGIPIIAVHENHTILEVTADKLGLPGVISVGTYPEAAGIILALRQGLSIESVHRPLWPFDIQNISPHRKGTSRVERPSAEKVVIA